jgi:hypothetical protein
VARAYTALERLRARIAAEPAWGVLGPQAQASGQAVLDDALRALGTYHTHPVVTLRDDHLHVEGMKLLFYYQNRTHHIPAEAVP